LGENSAEKLNDFLPQPVGRERHKESAWHCVEAFKRKFRDFPDEKMETLSFSKFQKKKTPEKPRCHSLQARLKR
jgi:hypothetical protein